MKKKLIMLASVMAISTLMVTACSDNKAQDTTEVAQQEQENPQADTSDKMPQREMGKRTVGKVTAVNGKSITIKLAQLPEMPEKMSEDTSFEQMPQGEKPQAPSDSETRPEPPQAPPKDRENGEDKADNEPKEMTFDGEEETIDVDETKLFKEGENREDRENASLSDIKEGSVLTFIYDEDGETVKEILLKNEEQ